MVGDAYWSPVFRSVRASSSASSINVASRLWARLPASGVGDAASTRMAALAAGNGSATGDETGIAMDADGTTPSSAEAALGWMRKDRGGGHETM